PLRRAVFQFAIFHIEQFHCAVPMPGDKAFGIAVYLHPGCNIGEIRRKPGQELFPAPCVELNAADPFHRERSFLHKNAPPAFARLRRRTYLFRVWAQSSPSVSASASIASSMRVSIVSACRAAFRRSMRALTVSFSRV